MPEREIHKWEFKSRFRREAFGWKSQPAITRIKEAVAEIKRVAKSAPLIGASGAIDFLERLSPAIERVDGSSGAIGRTVNDAIAALVPIISTAKVDPKFGNAAALKDVTDLIRKTVASDSTSDRFGFRILS